MTPSAQYADVVLPAASFLEKDGVRSLVGTPPEHQQGHEGG